MIDKTLLKQEKSAGKNQRSKKMVPAIPLIILAIFLMGTKECQEDYKLGAQTTVAATATATATATVTGTRTVTPTATPTGTILTGTATPVATATATDESEAARLARRINALSSNKLLDSLSELSALQKTPAPDSKPTPSAATVNPYAEVARGANWLGNAFTKNVKDSDGDGYCDWLEQAFGADANDAAITPPAPRTRLESAALRDSNSDGQIDSVAAASANLAADARLDSDGDRLPDVLERKFGSDQSLVDSDRDGASDSQEFALGLDPLNRDSDGDGILDGKEIELGSNPLVPESDAPNANN